jgi:ABC-2 type transport system ATP-binding protein
MTSTALTAGLRLRGLTKSYGPVRAVAGLDLDVVAGETVALLGPNGAGKSTTVDMLLGLTPPDAGTVEVFGRPPAEATRAGLVGAMLQSGGLISEVSVRELLALAGSLYPRPLPVDRVLELADLADLAGRRTTALSGGQAQRVRFALALVPDPELLVLDEPTAAMDVAARRRFWGTLRDAGRTVLFATHYLEEADLYADRVVLLAGGTVVADGTAAAVKAVVGGRTVRCTLTGPVPDVAGITSVERHGDAVTIRCADSDAVLRALLPTDARDFEVTGADLESAFLALTSPEESS